MLYTICEKQNVNSCREGITREFKSLTSAKRYASRNQIFQESVLTIEDNSGLVSHKEPGGKWVDNFDS